MQDFKSDSAGYIQGQNMPTSSRHIPGSEGNGIPLQTSTGPGGFRRLRLPEFLGSRQFDKIVSPTHQAAIRAVGNIK